MISVKYFAPWKDHSGYGNASRAFITALYCAGVNTTTELVVQVPEKSHYGLPEHIASSLENRDIDYKIKILHCTPDMIPRYMEAGKYHISHLFTETDRLPASWIAPLNTVGEIWTASERQAQMFRGSGIRVPIHSFAQPINIMAGEERIAPLEIRYKKDFTFYSIFQWIDRKNPRGLLRAYWREFEGNNNVTLLLKTYRVNYSEREYALIKSDIAAWRLELNQGHYPKILLVNKLLQERDMPRIHAYADCYVNASSSEGWSRPVHEAIIMGKPVISADNGGITDYLTEDSYYRVKSFPVVATEVSHIPWYTKDQSWWDIDEADLGNTMKTVFLETNRYARAGRAKQWAMEHTSYQEVGRQMKERLVQISRIF